MMVQANPDDNHIVAGSAAGLSDSGSPYQSNPTGQTLGSLTGGPPRPSREIDDSSPRPSSSHTAGNEASTLAAASSHPSAAATPTNSNMVPSSSKPQDAAEQDKEFPAVVASVSTDDGTIGGAPDMPGTVEPFDNGYHFPPKFKWQESTAFVLAAFWKYFITPTGFLVVIYCLNVVAWGAMIFFLLLNAAPAMCTPTCDDIDSPRRKWIEYDAQILTALFCVPAFGLVPWRFRDWYYVLKYRCLGDQQAIRKLAAFHNGWFRLRGSQELAIDIGPDNIPPNIEKDRLPFPETKMANPPLTGVRAPATAYWKMDFEVWAMVINTFGQCGLCGIMWGMNRYTRPSWATGFLVAFASLVAMAGGYVEFSEGKKVKSVEGVPLKQRDQDRLARDAELGIPHYNNIKDKEPKEKKRKNKSSKA